MKTFTTLIFLIVSLDLWAFSSYPSTVPALNIRNSHEVVPQVYRSSQPAKLVQEIVDYNFTDVVIFKNEVKDEVQKQVAFLSAQKVKTHHIAFPWKDITDPEATCLQVIEALKIIKRVETRGGKVLFHCTAGEDRTGLLAGLLRMQYEGLSMDGAFRDEMCAKGYADGNPKKPYTVTNPIHAGLTPLFVALAQKIEAGEKLSAASCRGIALKKTSLRCRK